MKRLISVVALLLAIGLSNGVRADGTIDTLSVGVTLTGVEKIPMFQTANPAVYTTPLAIGTYIAPLSVTFTNKVINCANNTCTVRLGSDVTGTLPSANMLPLPSADLYVGNGSNLPVAVAPSGDLTMLNTGAFTITGLQGRSVSATAPATTNVLAWNGSSWAPAAVSGGSGTVGSGTIYNLTYYPATGTAVAGIGSVGTTTTVLHGNAAGPPTFGAVALGTDVSGTLLAAQEPAHTGDVTNTAGSLAMTIANNATTNAKLATAAANTMKGNWTGSTANVSDNAMPSCPDSGSNHLNYVSGTGVTCGTAVSGTPVVFYGTTTNVGNAYTVASSTPTGFTLTDGFQLNIEFNVANVNGSTPTLAYGGTTATNICMQNLAGISALTGGELPLSRKTTLIYRAASSCYLMMPFSSDFTILASSPATITLPQWTKRSGFYTNTAGVAITLPSAATLAGTGGIEVVTGDVQVSLVPAAADGINGGVVNTAVNLPPNGDYFIRSAGVAGTSSGGVDRGILVPLGPVQYYPLTWAEGVNLSAAPRYIGRVKTPRTPIGMKCTVITAAGSASVIDIYSVASGTNPATGGTKLNTNSCDANAASFTEFDMVPNGSGIVADYTLWARFSGSGTLGNGGLTISFR